MLIAAECKTAKMFESSEVFNMSQQSSVDYLVQAVFSFNSSLHFLMSLGCMEVFLAHHKIVREMYNVE